MANRKKRSPVVRFLKRNGLYLMITMVVLLVAVAAIAVIAQVKNLSAAKKEPSSATVQQPVQEQLPSENREEQAPQTIEPVDENVYTPPFDGKTVLIADGRLVMTFDEEALALSESDTLLSLTDQDGTQKARLDVQSLNTDLALFKQSELERICIGVVQAYYYLAPETKDFTVTDAVSENGCFTATVNAPEYDTEAAVTACVALWSLDEKSYCVSAICPEGENGEAVVQAFSSIEPLGGKHIAEEAKS